MRHPKKSIDELAFPELPPENPSESDVKCYNNKMKQRLTYLQSKMLEEGMSETEISEKIAERL